MAGVSNGLSFFGSYWVTARFVSVCSKCGKRIVKGERVFYYPSSRSALCSREECGFEASRLCWRRGCVGKRGGGIPDSALVRGLPSKLYPASGQRYG